MLYKRYRVPLLLGMALLILLTSAFIGGPAVLQKLRGLAAHAASTQHYLYVFPDGQMDVYDMDNNFALVKQKTLPTTGSIRGVAVSPSDGMLYVSYGGDGGPNGNGSVFKYNLLNDSIVWTQNYPFGVDALAVTPNGQTIYLPDGANSYDGKWYIVRTSDGTVTGSITTLVGVSPHNTAVSPDGRFAYLGAIGANYLYVVDTSTNQIVKQIGSLRSGVRPFTFNGSQTLAYTTATGFLGFQVSSITSGQLLYDMPIQGFSAPPNSNAPSHGISLSPDESQIYVMDSPNSIVHVYSNAPGSAPQKIADIAVNSMAGTENPCGYDCQKEGWILHSLDGRFVFVGDAGNVISTATRQTVANLVPLANTRKFLEVDWSNGMTVATSTQHGMGYVGAGSGPTPPPSTPPGPVNKAWYFAEGRIGSGFREYLTVGNPSNTACAVNIAYNYVVEGTNTPQNKTVSLQVQPFSRYTESVNADMGRVDYQTPAIDVAAVVSVNNGSTPQCNGVVVERPMYFSNYHGISAGSDVLGSTHLSQVYFFADVPANSSYTSFLTILNPNNNAANVTVNYYVNGTQINTQKLQVSPNARGTIAPGQLNLGHVAAMVTSDQPILVERPTYFNLGSTTGAYDVVGVNTLANDWLFAEGYTQNFSEYLTIANIDPNNATANVTVTLKSQTGATNSYGLTLNAKSQTIWNVNANNNFAGATPEVSAEVTSSGGAVVVQRELYFHYSHTLPRGTLAASGGTDVIGQVGPAIHSSYSFAEGYTNNGYNEWLTIQNPTNNPETISITLVNGYGQSLVQTLSVAAHSRATQDITALVQGAMHAGSNINTNAVSMTVQTLNNGGVFVAERPMYWNTQSTSGFVTQGGSDIVGYIGG